MSDMRPDHRQQATHLVLLQHHEVEVLDAFLPVLPHPLSKGWLAYNIPNILVDETIPSRTCQKTIIVAPCERKGGYPLEDTHLGMPEPARNPKPFISV